MLGWCYEGRGRGFFPAVAGRACARILPRSCGTRLRADFGMRKGIWGGTWFGR